jgi:integrase
MSTEKEQKKERRQYGSGSVYQDARGIWRARCPRPNATTPKYFSGKTEAIVKKKLRDYQKSEEFLGSDSYSTQSVKRYAENWLLLYKKNSMKASSFDRVEGMINNNIVPEIGNIQMDNITSRHCQQLINDLQSNGMAFNTIKKIYNTMNNMFTKAYNLGDIKKNPMDTVDMPSSHLFAKKPIRALTEDEENKMLEEIERVWKSSGKPIYTYKELYKLILHTGMRCGEAVALNVEDMDLDEKTNFVHKTALFVKTRDESGKPDGGSKQVVNESPKTSKSNRKIPLNKTAFAAVKTLIDANPDSSYIATTSQGTRVSYYTIEKQFKRLMQNCGIESATVHTLRHTFATRLFEKGADVKTVSTLLGHSSVKITYDTYVHVIKEKQSDVVSLLDRGSVKNYAQKGLQSPRD